MNVTCTLQETKNLLSWLRYSMKKLESDDDAMTIAETLGVSEIISELETIVEQLESEESSDDDSDDDDGDDGDDDDDDGDEQSSHHHHKCEPVTWDDFERLMAQADEMSEQMEKIISVLRRWHHLNPMWFW